MNSKRTSAPSARTRVRRLAELADYERQTVYSILDATYVCHIAFHDGESTHCMATACWRDGNYLYVHGSNGSRLAKALAAGTQVAVAITHLDGLVLARSAFSHSMNYRAAVIYGQFERITGNTAKQAALDRFMDRIAPGRKHEARPGNHKELAATSVLRIALDEASAKISQGGPDDKVEDLDLPVWAGVLPLRTVHGKPVPAENGDLPTPAYVTNWVADRKKDSGAGPR